LFSPLFLLYLRMKFFKDIRKKNLLSDYKELCERMCSVDSALIDGAIEWIVWFNIKEELTNRMDKIRKEYKSL